MVVATSPQKPKSYPTKNCAKIHAYWRACNYLAVGMIYLRDNPLLREPLKPEQIKYRLLGHWGALSRPQLHLHSLQSVDQKKYDLDMIFMAGPGPRGSGASRSGLP